MEKNGEGTSTQEIVILGKRIQVGRENNGCASDENENEKGAKGIRIRWTADLHMSFLRALEKLGGPYRATPKQLIKLMGVQGLTSSHVQSHLQRYRNAIKLGKNEQGLLLQGRDESQVIAPEGGEEGDCTLFSKRKYKKSVDDRASSSQIALDLTL